MRAREDALASINHIPKTQATDRFVRTQKSGPDRQRSRHPVRIGSVGEGERAELDALSNQYNLRLLFAKQDSGEYLSAVQVNTLDAQGGTVLTAESSGPWFFTLLPAGDYLVDVSTPSQGLQEPQRQTVHIGGSVQSRRDFRWN